MLRTTRRINRLPSTHRVDLHPENELLLLRALRMLDPINELQPAVGYFSGGIWLVRRRHDSKRAVAKVMKPVAFLLWTHTHWL
jgi:hypothetical protein